MIRNIISHNGNHWLLCSRALFTSANSFSRCGIKREPCDARHYRDAEFTILLDFHRNFVTKKNRYAYWHQIHRQLSRHYNIAEQNDDKIAIGGAPSAGRRDPAKHRAHEKTPCRRWPTGRS